MRQAEVLDLVRAERRAQNEKWGRTEGVWHSEEETKLAVLVEEVGEVVEAYGAYKSGGERKYELELLRGELVQVAAVAVAWLEDAWRVPTEEALDSALRVFQVVSIERLDGTVWAATATVELGRLARAVLEENKPDVCWCVRKMFSHAMNWLERLEVKP